MFEFLEDMNPHWVGKPRRVKPRLMRLSYTPGKMNAVLGMRRVGKTHFIYQEIHRLLHEGVPPQRIVYLNFFHVRLTPYQKGERLYDLLRAFLSHGEGPAYVFLDEIQEVKDWERVVESLREEAFITVTGSTSTLMHGEIGKRLAGRTRKHVVYPLTLEEYELWTGQRVEGEAVLTVYARSALPEYVLYEDDLILLETYQDILRRDVFTRAPPEDHAYLEDLAYALLNTLGSPFTFSSLSRLTGMPYAKVRSLLPLLVEAYLFTLIHTYTHKPGVYLRAPRKAYAMDTGFVRLLKTRTTEDTGRIMELLVERSMLQVLRPEEQVYRYQTKQQYEVDFFVTRRNKACCLIQVTLDDTPHPRELRALLHARKEVGGKLLIVTLTREGVEEVSWHGMTGRVRYVPLDAWLRGARRFLDEAEES